MADSESIKKMLRSVLQSSKAGVFINRLQSEYQSLCGESIPLKKLGFSKLEDYLRSIPSVVRLEYRLGELRCFATVCQETAHIAELVARQKNSKKSGHSHVGYCKKRFKSSNPYVPNARSSLRQPSAAGASACSANGSRTQQMRRRKNRLPSAPPSDLVVPARVTSSQTQTRQAASQALPGDR